MGIAQLTVKTSCIDPRDITDLDVNSLYPDPPLDVRRDAARFIDEHYNFIMPRGRLIWSPLKKFIPRKKRRLMAQLARRRRRAKPHNFTTTIRHKLELIKQ